MTIAEYAKDRGVSKQSVYDRLKRGTLQYEVIDGIKHIVASTTGQGFSTTVAPVLDTKVHKRLAKALKKVEKLKFKLLLAESQLNSMAELVSAKDDQIATLQVSMDFIEKVVSKKLVQLDHSSDGAIDAEIEPVKKKKRKK